MNHFNCLAILVAALALMVPADFALASGPADESDIEINIGALTQDRLAGTAEDEFNNFDPEEYMDAREMDKVHQIGQSAQNTMNFIRLFSGKYYELPYNQINSELEKHFDTSRGLKANMDSAVNYLRELKASHLRIFHKALIDALRQFTALRQFSRGKIGCDRQSYSILVKNDRAVRGHAHKRVSALKQKLNRVEWVINQYSLQHALTCLPQYPKLFRASGHLIDAEKLRRVRFFMTLAVDAHRNILRFTGEGPDPKDIYESAIKIKKFRGRTIAGSIRESLGILSQNDPRANYINEVEEGHSGEGVVNKRRLKELLDIYIFDPCYEYVRAFGPDFFIPAEYDAQMLEPSDLAELPYKDIEFAVDKSYYRLCNIIINRDQDRLVKDVAKVVKRNLE